MASPIFAQRSAGDRRLLDKGPQSVIATGGGAFVNPDTRALVRVRAVSVWLKAEVDLLLRR